MNSRSKIIPFAELAAWRESFRQSGRLLVATNGCFDILHAGHVSYLEQARNQADALLVGLNSDAAVRELKGELRPINSEADRAIVLAALEAVTAVCIFAGTRATEFLAAASPDVYVKGGDYTLATLNADERRAVEERGGRIVLIPFIPGKSTSGLVDRILRL